MVLSTKQVRTRLEQWQPVYAQIGPKRVRVISVTRHRCGLLTVMEIDHTLHRDLLVDEVRFDDGSAA